MRTIKQLHYPTNRQAIAAVIACAVLLTLLIVMWLALATSTAIVHQQLDESDARQRQLTEQANQLWMEIGDVTSPTEMNRRMKEAGFGTPAGTEYLFVPTIPTVSAVMTPTTAAGTDAQGGTR